MDKKELLSKSLAKIMVGYLGDIQHLVQSNLQPSVQQKADGSPVTQLDLALSDLVERIALEAYGDKVTFYSEEKFDQWKFPLLALDPLDGTREYVAGRPEWALSIGVFPDSNFTGEGWVYNPLTQECYSGVSTRPHQAKAQYAGEVSRSEWERGLFTGRGTGQFSISPMGSIAYKLGRLAGGKTDFVVSLKPKNIWDIAGGTLLCHQAGLKFYSQGKEVTEVQKLYEPPLIWCHEELFSELSSLFP